MRLSQEFSRPVAKVSPSLMKCTLAPFLVIWLHRCCPGGGCDGADIRTHKIRLLITPATTHLVRKILTLTKKTTR